MTAQREPAAPVTVFRIEMHRSLCAQVADAPRAAVAGGWRGWGASVAEYLLGP